MKDINAARIVFNRAFKREREAGRVTPAIDAAGELVSLTLAECDQVAARICKTGRAHKAALQALDAFEIAWKAGNADQQIRNMP